MNAAQASSPSPDLSLFEVRASDREQRIQTCAVDLEFLRRVLRTLKRAGDKAADLELSQQNPDQFDEQAHEPAQALSQAKARNAVAITVIGASGESFQGFNDENHLDPAGLPQPLISVIFDTGALYRRAGKTPPNSAVVHFDFSKPPVLDLSNPSGEPTPNKSFLKVSGSDNVWVSGIHSELVDLLDKRRVPWGWLHRAGTYDALLFVLGIPAALSAGVVVDSALAASISTPLRTGVLAYVFFASLLLFRLFFSVVRWLYPHIEMLGDPKPVALKGRRIVLTILLGALGSLLAAGLIYLF